MSNNNIPEKTIERLSEYRRTLMNLHRQGITHIFSHVLAGMQGITAVQVRRDLMLIGFSSDTKKGYDVEVLIDFINGILDSPTPMNIAVIGMGHLGQAITRYFNGKGLNLKIVAAFDVDPEKVGQTIEEIPCYSMDDFEADVSSLDINIAVLSCPSRIASDLVVPIVNAGIEGTGVHMYIGKGGAPEGVLAAAAIKCLGGDMQARLCPEDDEQVKRCLEMGICDCQQVLSLDDMVKGDDCMFTATAITESNLLSGLRYFGGGVRTHTVSMRYKTGTVRFVDAVHSFDRKDFAVKL